MSAQHVDEDEAPRPTRLSGNRRNASSDLRRVHDRKLIRAVRLQKPGAFEALMRAHGWYIHRLVGDVARSAKVEHEIEDLMQQARIGMWRAIQKWDPKRGFLFWTYAMYWVRHEVIQYADERCALVHASSAAHGRVRRLRRQGQEPYFSSNKIDRILSRKLRMVSLDAPIRGNDNAKTMVERMADPDGPTGWSVGPRILEMLYNGLSIWMLEGANHLERAVLVRRFWEDLTLDESGWGRSRERTRQVQEYGLRRIRRTMPSDVAHLTAVEREEWLHVMTVACSRLDPGTSLRRTIATEIDAALSRARVAAGLVQPIGDRTPETPPGYVKVTKANLIAAIREHGLRGATITQTQHKRPA